MIKHCTIQILFIQCVHDGFNGTYDRVLVLFNHRSLILILFFPQQFLFIMGLEIKLCLVGVMFAYPYVKVEEFDFELCLPIDSMSALGNDQEFKAFLL